MSKFEMRVFGMAVALLATSGASAQLNYPDTINDLDAQLQILQKQEQVDAALKRKVDPSLTSLPNVVAVLGLEGDLKARLMLSSGVVLTYSEGEQINSIMKVASITPRQVTVAVAPKSKKAKTTLIPLQFHAGATMNGMNGMPGVGMPGQGPAMPLPPGLMPSAPSIQGFQMPTPVMQQQRQGPPGPAQAAPGAPGMPVAAGGPAVPGNQGGRGRPDQDLMDAGVSR